VADRQLVGQVRLVAEEHAVDTGALEDLQVATDDVGEPFDLGSAVVLWPTGQAWEVEHRDERLVHPEDPT
jgi:hypothetical protein